LDYELLSKKVDVVDDKNTKVIIEKKTGLKCEQYQEIMERLKKFIQ
jgi:hypothetical protein